MTATRRDFVRTVGAAAAAAGIGSSITLAQGGHAAASTPRLIRPKRLKPGDTVGLIDPASATFEKVDVQIVAESLAALGLKAKPGEHLFARHGYLAGEDKERAADVNRMFADKSVDAILAVRGGWGCARLLPLLDYDTIRANPKILLGYSDLTALLLGIHARTGLVTFHGPVGISSWNAFNVDSVRRVLIDAQAASFANPVDFGDNLTQVEDRVQTITPGTARGPLLGGNLTVLTAIVGSPYLPSFDGAVLFVEDTNEQIYRIDRMLTQLRLAGILTRLAGFIFGHCTKCDPGEGYGALTLEEVFADHITPLGIQAWSGAMIGHNGKQFVLGEGTEVEIDAAKGTIRMVEPAVS